MDRLVRMRWKVAAGVYLLADVVCTGMGMGVPIFCILLGFPLGWYCARRAMLEEDDLREVLRRVFVWSALGAAFTFLLMIVIWGRIVPMLFDPSADFENFGHPMILYDPRLSLVGWLVLMILVSPFLQMLTTLFGAHMTLIVGRLSGRAQQ